jgi:HTH-type transcriptional regulator, transcriptional repressor of NAD biosynthesis genes
VMRGLVIGKFYPPHRGHHHLIDYATTRVDHLDVVVCSRPDQGIRGEVRASWLRERHPNADVTVVQDICDDDNSRAWADYTRSFLGYAPDIVFTSEPYGDTYAGFLRARHIAVDPSRRRVAICATNIRRDPLANWQFLEPPVRAHFAVRVCVVGAESTGTTTMAQKLAEHFKTLWVPEYGRDYWVKKSGLEGPFGTWKTDEFVHIATEQQKLEDELARSCSGLLVCDTDALATSIWHERYVGSRSDEVRQIAARRSYPLYFLTDCDIPFVQDGTRDGEQIRTWMTRRFQEELSRIGANWKLLTGDIDRRLNQAIGEIESLLLRKPTSLPDPTQIDSQRPVP